MINIFLRGLVMAALGVVMGCASESTGGGSVTLNATTTSSSSVALTGSYDTACYIQNGSGFKENVAFSGDSWTYTTSTYSGTTCSGTSTDVEIIATMSVVADQQIAGWVNGNGDTVTAPAGTQGASFTALNLTVSSSEDAATPVGLTVGMGYVIDDSNATGLTFYRMDDVVNSIATIADPFTDIPVAAVQPLMVTTASGGTVALEGTFINACYGSDYDNDTIVDGNIDTWVISGNTITAESVYYPSDTTCSGNPVIIENIIGDLSSGSDANLTAWVDGFANPASAPASAGNLSLSLPANPPYTTVTIEITSINGAVPSSPVSIPFSFVVDDSHTNGLTIYQTNFDSVAGQASVDDFRKNY
ncbi:MAG: hypothetical protein OEY11_00985 [Gammaproteobacteria bacterium]|nr:hypothetical protein [Gammaproteobacteria bacterium]